MKKEPLTLGAHLSIAGGLHNALLAAQKLGCQCVQLFVANQRQWHHPPLIPSQIDTFQQIRRQTCLDPVVAHSSYLINPAAADRTIYRKSLAALLDEYRRCHLLDIDFLVLHPGSHRGRGVIQGIHKVSSTLNRVLEKVPARTKILLETTAGAGHSLGHTFEHLARIIHTVEPPDRLGVCLDTSHIFAAGYDLRTDDGYRHTIALFDETIGLDRLCIIHANDSKTDLNSRLDRHDHIGKGKLGKSAFRRLLTDRRIRRRPFILETPKGLSPGGRDLDRLNLAALRRLAHP